MHKRDGLPALDLLRGFEAAARHLSFTKAGAELFLSQSAVSRQIQELERQVGTALFIRRTRALVLTDAGQRYYHDVSAILQQLRDATARLAAPALERTVTVTTTVTFASLWLVPRLAAFQERHPDIAIHVAADNVLRDLEEERLDVSVRYSSQRLAGPGAIKLFGERVAVVCSPRLLAGRALKTPADLQEFSLLDFEDPVHATPWLSWEVWFEVMKVKPVTPRAAARFSHYDQLVRAAVNGQGVALGRLPLIESLLKDGSLVTPLEGRRFSTDAQDRAFWLVVSRAAQDRAAVGTFAQWLLGEAKAAAAEP